MPIYGDYHGDFQNSNNSSWDQIQASLKILLPSYPPIPYDNLDELSFMSDQKQKRLCAEIKETCNRICATLNEMIQEEESPDPENYNKDLDAIATSLEIQINEEIDADLDSTTHSSTNSLKSEANNSENSNHSFITDVESGTKIQKSLTTTIEIQKSPSDQKQEDEDEFDDWNIHNGFDDRSTTVAVQRPPLESPDLTLLAVGEGEPTSTVFLAATTSHRSEDVRDAVTGVHSGAEDGAVAKGNVDITEVDPAVVENDVDDKSESSAEVGAPAKEKRRRFVAGVEGAPSVTGGGLRAQGFCWVSPIVAKPPLLMAAVLPWNREEERRTEGNQHLGTAPAPPYELARRGGSRTNGSIATTGEWLIVATQNIAAELGGDRGASWRVVNEWKKIEAASIGEAAARLMGKESIRVTSAKGGTNEAVCWRPWLYIVGQWQAQTQHFEESIKFLFGLLGQNQSETHGTQQAWYILIDRYYFKPWDPGG